MVPKRLALFSGELTPLAAFGTVCGMVFPVLMFPAAILFALAELLIPELARCSAAGSILRIRYLVKRSLKIALLYGCLCGGIMHLIARPLCVALYDSIEAGHQLRLYSILIPMLYCDTIVDAMIKGLGQQTASVRYNILTSSMDVAFLFLLLPRYGMMGYFFSFLVTHLLNFILSLRRLLKIVGTVISTKIAVFAIAATGCAAFVASHVSTPGIRAASFVVIWSLLLFLLQVLGKEDIAWIKGLIMKKNREGCQ
jgi:stage V sporulation protein B